MKKKKLPSTGKYEFSASLAEVTTLGRANAELTQDKVSKMTLVDKRTLMGMENGGGNPTLEKLYSVIRLYAVDPRPIFYPELALHDPVRENLRFLLETCTEKEAKVLIPIVRAILDALRAKDGDKL